LRVGVIGTGNMGGMLARAFAAKRDVRVFAYNRTREKLVALIEQVPEITACPSAEDVIRSSDVVFLCTKSGDGMPLIRALGHLFRPNQIFVTTISAVPLAEWVQHMHGSVVKLIPSLTQSVNAGIALTTYGHRCTIADVDTINQLFDGIATPLQIEEPQVRISSDLTSCGPAFMSYLFMRWAEAAADTGNIRTVVAENMLRETVIGLAALLTDGMDFADIVAKIAVPGGVTEVGLGALNGGAYRLFADLHQHTHHATHQPMTNKSKLSSGAAMPNSFLAVHPLHSIPDNH